MYIINNAKFDPFSYQEMLQPVAMATQTHQQLEDQYNDLNTRSNVWDQVTQNPKEDYARKLYEGYTKDLNTQVSDLMKTGLTPNSRAGLNTMRSRYTKEIVPIEIAYNRRKELSDKQRELQEKDNTVFFNKNAADYTISDFIKNPNIQTQTQSGKALEEESMKVFENLKKEVRKNPDQWNKILQGQYFQNDKVEGYSSAEIYNTLAKTEKGSQIINGIIDQITNTSAAAQWGDPKAYLKARRAVEKGAWSAVGTTDIKTLENKNYDYYLKHKDDPKPPTNVPFRAVPHLTVDGNIKTTEINNDAEWLNKLLTPEGLKSLDTPAKRNLKGEEGTVKYQSSWGAPVDRQQETYYPNVDKLKKLNDKYKINLNIKTDKNGKLINGDKNNALNLKEAVQKMQTEIEKSVRRDQDYVQNVTDTKPAKATLSQNMNALYSSNQTTGLKDFENGQIGKNVNNEDANTFFEGDKFSVHLNPTKGIIASNVVKGKTVNKWIDPAIIDPSGKGGLRNDINNLNELLKIKNPNSETLQNVDKLIKEIGLSIHDYFDQSKVNIQGTTGKY